MLTFKERICSLLIFAALFTFAALSARADTVTYTFESPQFTAGEITPLLNRAPNTGASAFRASFTSDPDADGLQIEDFQPNPLFTGNTLYAPGGAETLTISFNTPVQNVQFDFALNLLVEDPIGIILLESPVGSVFDAGDDVGGDFQGGTFVFSTITPFTTLQLSAYVGVDGEIFPIEFAIDNLSITYTAPPSTVPEPATMLLLGTGLVGLGGMIKRKRQGKDK